MYDASRISILPPIGSMASSLDSAQIPTRIRLERTTQMKRIKTMTRPKAMTALVTQGPVLDVLEVVLRGAVSVLNMVKAQRE